jgi:DNA polymerase-3 subunit gamma/tau
MASEALYLKYRPLSPYDVIGQSHIIDILLAQTQLQRFSNAYLLYGPRGTGKTTTARLIAKLVNADTGSVAKDGSVDLGNDALAQKIGS